MVQELGVYIINIETETCTLKDTFRLDLLPIPAINLSADRLQACQGESISLRVENPRA